jgi:hypothetical protein
MWLEKEPEQHQLITLRTMQSLCLKIVAGTLITWFLCFAIDPEFVFYLAVSAIIVLVLKLSAEMFISNSELP